MLYRTRYNSIGKIVKTSCEYIKKGIINDRVDLTLTEFVIKNNSNCY